MNDNDSNQQSDTEFDNYFVINDVKGSDSGISGFDDKDSYSQKDFQDSQDLELSKSLPKTQIKPQQQNKKNQQTSKYQEEKSKLEREHQETLRKREQERRELEEQMKKIKQETSMNEEKDMDKDDAYKYFQQKFKQDVSEKDDESEISIDEENVSQGDQKFEEDYSSDNNFEESHETDKQKHEIKMEKSNQQKNPFKDQALVQTLHNQKTSKEIEIKMKDDIQHQSEIGFEDEEDQIEENFSEEPIDDEFEKSDQSQKQIRQENTAVNIGSVISNPKIQGTKTKGETTVNFGSVITNPKIIQNEFTKQNTDFYSKQKSDESQEIEEEQHKDESDKGDKSFQQILEGINEIKPRWSPNQTQPTKRRPSTVRKRIDANNKDLGEVLNSEQPSIKEPNNLVKEERKERKPQKITLASLMGPEQLKQPKVGYDGKVNVLAQNIPKLNTNDLSKQIASSKKFQMIKKLKEEKERKKEMIVRNLQKTNIVQTKQKKKQETPKGSQLSKSNNDEEDDLFKEADAIKGDEAAFQDDFEDHLSMIKNDKEDEFNMMQDSKRESVRDIKQKKQEQQQPKSMASWVGNALGSGQYQQAHDPIRTENVNIQLDSQKKPKETPKEQATKEQGWNNRLTAALGKGLNKAVDDNKSQQDEAKAKFQEVLREKKEKQQKNNKDVLGYMLEKQLKSKAEKDKQMEQGVNKLVKDFDVKSTKEQGNKGSDKVPEHAKLVIDNESQCKDLQDLKKRLKDINYENKKIQGNIKLVEKKKRETEANLDQIMSEKNLVNINGRLEMQTDLTTGNLSAFGIKLDDIPNFDSLAQEKINPLESVVKKIEDCGYTLDQVFILLDDNGDEVLTIQEIKEGLTHQGIVLTDSEMNELVKQIDANNDGVLTMEEWINTLNPRIDVQREYNQIMQGLNIDDPLVLEERILDLKYRFRRLNTELEVLRETRGLEHGFDKTKKLNKNPMQKKFADKIKVLETRLSDKVNEMKNEQDQLEQKIKDGLMKKDQIHQDYYQLQRAKERQESEYSMRLQQIQGHLNILDFKLNEVTQLNLMLKNERENLKQEINRQQIRISTMSELESKLDKQLEEILGKAVDGKDLEMLYELDLKTLRQLNSGNNEKFNSYVEHCAAVTLQRRFRGFMDRNRFKIMKTNMVNLVRRLEPMYLKKKQSQKVRAATIIQKMFRRNKARKEQLERIKQKNQMRKLLEEEDEMYRKSEQQRQDAARIIIKHWRIHKAQKKNDMLHVMRSAQAKTYSRFIETIYLAVVRKCLICKTSNGQRLCPGCNDAIYCENCYLEYHMRGHRKTHIYKRIRFGTKVEDTVQVNTMTTKENKQPNMSQTQQPQKSNLKDTNQRLNEDQKKPKGTVKFVEEQKIEESLPQKFKVVAPQSKTKLTDEEFLKSMKTHLDWDEIAGFEFQDEESRLIRLSDFKKGLMQMQKEFKLTEDEIERICEIAHNKCQTTNDMEDSNVLEDWIDAQQLKIFVIS